jgi:Na+/H+ antiporter NhaC
VDVSEEDGAQAQAASAPWRALGPIAVLLVGIPLGIYIDGIPRSGFEHYLPVSAESISAAFGQANTPLILITCCILAALVAWASLPKGRHSGAGNAFLGGIEQLFRPVLILVSAWILTSTLQHLEAGAYLSQWVGGRMPPGLLPLVVFLVGSLIAFSTGTSWGTMGLLMPLSIAMCLEIPEMAALPYLIPAVVGAVFSGAVFGDHCSPISDTTIVSSIACGIDPFDHVRTQLPYAMFAGLWAALAGFLSLLWFPVKLAILPVCAVLLVVFLLWSSRIKKYS